MLLDDNTIWLDLEIDPTSENLLLGAFLLDSDYWTFDQAKLVEQKQRVIELLNQSAYLGGHNILEFDLPHKGWRNLVSRKSPIFWRQAITFCGCAVCSVLDKLSITKKQLKILQKYGITRKKLNFA